MFVLFQLLLVNLTTQSREEVRADCDEEVSLMCSEALLKNTTFLYVAWYKVRETSPIGSECFRVRPPTKSLCSPLCSSATAISRASSGRIEATRPGPTTNTTSGLERDTVCWFPGWRLNTQASTSAPSTLRSEVRTWMSEWSCRLTVRPEVNFITGGTSEHLGHSCFLSRTRESFTSCYFSFYCKVIKTVVMIYCTSYWCWGERGVTSYLIILSF